MAQSLAVEPKVETSIAKEDPIDACQMVLDLGVRASGNVAVGPDERNFSVVRFNWNNKLLYLKFFELISDNLGYIE